MKRRDPLACSPAPSSWYPPLVWILNFFPPPKAKVSSPTETERCIESLIAVFQKHAGRDGNNTKLSKAEFLIFMNTELGAFTKVLVPAPHPKLQDPGRTPGLEWRTAAEPPGLSELWMAIKGSFLLLFLNNMWSKYQSYQTIHDIGNTDLFFF